MSSAAHTSPAVPENRTPCSGAVRSAMETTRPASPAEEPGAALDELFAMIEAAWAAAGPGRP